MGAQSLRNARQCNGRAVATRVAIALGIAGVFCQPSLRNCLYRACAVFARQQPSPKRRLGENRKAKVGGHRQQFHLGLPLDQRIHRLDCVNLRAKAARDALRFDHHPSWKV